MEDILPQTGTEPCRPTRIPPQTPHLITTLPISPRPTPRERRFPKDKTPSPSPITAIFLNLDYSHTQPLPTTTLNLHTTMTVTTFAAPPKPRYFWRVTDSTSLTRLNHKSSFDTNAQLWGHWSYWTSTINTPALNAQIDWSHRFTPTTADGPGNDPPLFISVTDDVRWAYDEFDRRFRRRREEVRIHVIDTATFEWDLAFLECGARLPVLRDAESGCTFFSSRDASVALDWQHRYRNSREWFAIKWIPARVILPDVWGND